MEVYIYVIIVIGSLITGILSINLQSPCTADECKLPSCRCPGTDIPGNLPPVDTPQIIVFTFDDAINDQVNHDIIPIHLDGMGES